MTRWHRIHSNWRRISPFYPLWPSSLLTLSPLSLLRFPSVPRAAVSYSTNSTNKLGPLEIFLKENDLSEYDYLEKEFMAQGLNYPVQEEPLESFIPVESHESTSIPIPDVETPAHSLRPYQEECITVSLSSYFDDNIKRQAVSLPVGSGKTVVFANLLQQFPPQKPGADKVLVLAHRKELLDQAYNQIQRAAPHLRVAVDGGGQKEPKDLSLYDVIIASVPALGSSNSIRRSKYNPDEFKMIIIDEAHHSAAPTYLRIFDHFDIWNEQSHIFVWGCSATLRRTDALSLGKIFEEIVYERGFLEMIKEGYLSNFVLKRLRTPVDLSRVRSQSGDYSVDDLVEAINTDKRNKLIVQTWLNVQATDSRMSTLVFAASIKHVESLAAEFESAGIAAQFLHSQSIHPTERQAIVQKFRDGKFPVLINCGILTEGTDIPNVDCIVLARPTRSSILYQQMIGRGLRLHHKKSDCLVIDVVDQHVKADLVTAPSLLGLDPTFDPGTNTEFTDLADVATRLHEMNYGDEVSSLDEAKSILDPNNSSPKLKSMSQDSMSLLDLATDKAGQNWLHNPRTEFDDELLTVGTADKLMERAMKEAVSHPEMDTMFKSKNDWFFIRRDVIGLHLPNHELLLVNFSEYPNFKITKNMKIEKSDGRRIQINKDLSPEISGDSLGMIITACDMWVKRLFPIQAYLCTRELAQRSGPATESQINFLKKLGYLTIPDGSQGSHDELINRRELQLKHMTKIEATKAITRIRFGAGQASRKADKIRHNSVRTINNRLAKSKLIGI